MFSWSIGFTKPTNSANTGTITTLLCTSTNTNTHGDDEPCIIRCRSKSPSGRGCFDGTWVLIVTCRRTSGLYIVACCRQRMWLPNTQGKRTHSPLRGVAMQPFDKLLWTFVIIIRDVVLKTTVLVSRTLKTRILWSWSWHLWPWSPKIGLGCFQDRSIIC